MLQLEVIGNIGSDAEIKEINGKKYVSFSVADSYRGTDGQGNRIDKTTWVSVLWYGEGGRLIQWLKKGAKVFVRGRMSIKEWTDRTGAKNISINVTASEVNLCGINEVQEAAGTSEPASGGGNGSLYPDTARAVQEVHRVAAAESGQEVDDLPF